MKRKNLLVSLALFFFINCIIFSIMYSAQSKPFIDEIFHIPQTIKYCRGYFDEWDPKITTLPGLYYISVGVLMPLSALTGVDLCCVYGLRAINLIVSAVNFYLIYNISKRLHPNVMTPYKHNALQVGCFKVLMEKPSTQLHCRNSEKGFGRGGSIPLISPFSYNTASDNPWPECHLRDIGNVVVNLW
ncbi:glucosyltransferase [Homalodisca vitripennis]|nr:glucosyltransferase [Homalodisca vitripennis]